MKKSQVLAALALAFALGVAVIPSASTYAYVGGNAAGNMTAEQGTAITRDLNNAILKAESVDNYVNYEWLANAIEMYNNAFEPVVKAQLTALKKAVKSANNSYATGISTTGDLRAVYGAVSTGIKQLTNKKDILDRKTDKTPAEEADVKNMEAALKALGDAKSTASTELNNVVTTVSITSDTILSYVEKISEDAADKVANSDTYTDAATGAAEKVGLAIAAANALPKTSVITPLVKAVEEAEKVVATQANGGQYYSYEEATKALNDLNAAIAKFNNTSTDGTGDGTNKPDDNTDDEKDPSAPDTGILSNTEASASTTLAMVAGIATALTAAGAGVVAYRNARRSARK